MKKSIVLVLVIALCGCVSSKKPLPPIVQPLHGTKAAAPAPHPLSPQSAPKGPALAAISAKLSANPLVITWVKVVYDANSFWFRYNCAKPTNIHGFLWCKTQAGLNGNDDWFMSLSARDDGTNATCLIPCMANGRPNAPIYIEFMGTDTAAEASKAMPLRPTARKPRLTATFEQQLTKAQAKHAKDSDRWAIRPDGTVFKLVP